MGKLTVQEIARLIGRDQGAALQFCATIQRMCNPAPPRSAIAEALRRSDFRSTTVADVARLATQIQAEARRAKISPKKSPRGSKNKSPRLQRLDHKPAPVIAAVTARPVFQVSVTAQSAPPAQPAVVPVPDSPKLPPGLPLDPGAVSTSQTRFAQSIRGRVIDFTGDGPYGEDQLTQLARQFKAIPDDVSISWDDLEWVVIGAEGFDLEYLAHAVSMRQVRFLTQEQFLGEWLFGEPALASAAAAWLERTHEGLRFVREVARTAPLGLPVAALTPAKAPMPEPPPPVPAVEANRPPAPPAPNPGATSPVANSPPTQPRVYPGITTYPAYEPAGGWNAASPSRTTPMRAALSRPGGASETKPAPVVFPSVSTRATTPRGDTDPRQLNLRLESELKRLGYHVRSGGSRTYRKLALQKGVEQLGLQAVVDHLAFLIRFHRNSPNKRDAVALWNEDLQWIKRAYAPRLK